MSDTNMAAGAIESCDVSIPLFLAPVGPPTAAAAPPAASAVPAAAGGGGAGPAAPIPILAPAPNPLPAAAAAAAAGGARLNRTSSEPLGAATVSTTLLTSSKSDDFILSMPEHTYDSSHHQHSGHSHIYTGLRSAWLTLQSMLSATTTTATTTPTTATRFRSTDQLSSSERAANPLVVMATARSVDHIDQLYTSASVAAAEGDDESRPLIDNGGAPARHMRHHQHLHYRQHQHHHRNQQQQQQQEQQQQQMAEECRICFEQCRPDQVKQLTHCGCRFCLQCLGRYVEVQIHDGRSHIVCPDAGCRVDGARLTGEEIHCLLTDLRSLQLYQQLRKTHEVCGNPLRMWCPLPDCETVCHLSHPADGSFSCPSCRHLWCVVCRKQLTVVPATTSSSSPNPKSSGDNQQQQLEQHECRLEQMVTPTDGVMLVVKACPHCGSLIERDAGCAQVLCRLCRHTFCWYCLHSLDGDFLLRHYDRGPCQQLLGHSRLSLLWHRTLLVGAMILLALLLVLLLPLLLAILPLLFCCFCCCGICDASSAADSSSSPEEAAEGADKSNETEDAEAPVAARGSVTARQSSTASYTYFPWVP